MSFRKISKQLKIEQKVKPVFKIPVFYKVAAAMLFLITGIFITYTYFNRFPMNRHAISHIQPGTQKAVLTTSDNHRIALGNIPQKSTYSDGNAILVDTGSTLIYRIKGNAEAKETGAEAGNSVACNQLETPRGGEYTLILPDGTEVKLNSQTRVRFPVHFDKNTRQVELEGEAFFDVVKSDAIPFVVITGGMKITVYGTAFNVCAYRDDDFIQTTLVQGSVEVSLSNIEKPVEIKLKPGQQACYNENPECSGNKRSKYPSLYSMDERPVCVRE